MKKYLLLHKIFIKQYIKQILEYKADFIIGLTGVIVSQGFTLVFLSIIFSKIPRLVGWSFHDIMFIYGFSLLPKGIDHLFFDNLWALGQRLIRRGDFDKYLLRPINPLFHVMVEIFQIDALGELIFSVILFFYTVPYMDWTFAKIIILFLSIIFATLIYTSIKVIAASISFWSKQSGGLIYIFYMFNDFAKYPVSIYNSIIKWIISFLLPFAFTAFYPASYFLTKKNFLYNNKLYVYILKDKNKIIGINFVSLGENIIKKFKKDNNLEKENENNNKAGILSAFHILKKYRNKGIGFKWLNQEVFRDLKTKGIEIIYIKSSHNKALNLYDKLGERVGNYIGISDNHLYQRLGYIFKIKI